MFEIRKTQELGDAPTTDALSATLESLAGFGLQPDKPLDNPAERVRLMHKWHDMNYQRQSHHSAHAVALAAVASGQFTGEAYAALVKQAAEAVSEATTLTRKMDFVSHRIRELENEARDERERQLMVKVMTDAIVAALNRTTP